VEGEELDFSEVSSGVDSEVWVLKSGSGNFRFGFLKLVIL